ncbi:MAG: RDD family protein [Defluviitaleaceae bacterium]|nr:RDD family protein [Defluviitaleaceae bacterium]
MKTITIITPSNIEVEYRLAGAGSRLASFLIDFMVQGLIFIAIVLIVLFGFDRVIFGNTDYPSGVALGIVMVTWFVLQFGYFVICELSMQGQSIGKRIFGLRVIRDNGQPLEFSQSLIRGLLRTSADMMYIGIFIILFSKKHKRLGDMAAGTLVVSERYNETYQPSLVNATPHWPSFLPNRDLLTPSELQLTEEWLHRRNQMLDGGAAVGERLAEYFAKYKQVEEPEEVNELWKQDIANTVDT